MNEQEMLDTAINSLQSACQLLRSTHMRVSLQKDREAREIILAECTKLKDLMEKLNLAVAKAEMELFYQQQMQMSWTEV